VSPLVVGPRCLTASGEVEVWIDTGSGPGFTAPVPVGHLSLTRLDDGQGDDAIYHLNPGYIPVQAND
jgi:hypothetical protein